jgi:LAO/AO transport system kinase
MGLASKVLAGDISAAAKLISEIEDKTPGSLAEMSRLYPHTGKAYVIGVTGSPGAGKSTLTNNLIDFFRKKNMTVGVIAVDPTSAFTGGAILGDRVRMQKHSADKDVFIRSLATRGWVGGLSKATIGAIHVMDAMGKDIILVETVGSGQIEIDITRAADTTLIVLTPYSGDEIQMMKAGILEAADIFVINKADKGGADILKTNLEVMLTTKANLAGEWRSPIVLTEAVYGKGTEPLADELFRHREFLISTGELETRQRERVKLELMETVESFLRDFIHGIDKGDYLKKFIDALAKGDTNPQAAASEITGRLARELYRRSDDKVDMDAA